MGEMQVCCTFNEDFCDLPLGRRGARPSVPQPCPLLRGGPRRQAWPPTTDTPGLPAAAQRARGVPTADTHQVPRAGRSNSTRGRPTRGRPGPVPTSPSRTNPRAARGPAPGQV